ncbi:MAG TPA: M20/M25/M40 family metallo-hydrolase [Anaerolineales bacterium]|nr:M20/M25/M40 family metallo-hydrolase [Anaerolineales bacterium]
MNDLVDRLVELAIQIQQIPAPTFREEKRAEFIHELFAREPLHDICIDEAGNVLARFPGMGESRPLIVSAHMDTVFPFETDLSIKRGPGLIHGPGLGDNSMGVAALFGLLWSLCERQIPLRGDVWFVANVCEEGLGDLRGMKAVVDRFGADVHAYLVLEGLALGHVYHRAVGVKRYRVNVRTGGGHSWSDYGQPSAVHELARLVVGLTSLSLPAHPRTTMNVGKISGGTSVNVIASEASLDLDLRSEGREALAELVAVVEKLIRHANRPGVSVEADVIGQRPAGDLSAGHPLVLLGKDCLREQGLEAGLISGSTDANVPLSKGYPAIVLGVTTGGSAHTVQEYINTAPIAKGMEQLVNFVSRVWT